MSPDRWDLQQMNIATTIVIYKKSGGYACVSQFWAPGGTTNCRPGVSIDAINGTEIKISSVDYDDAGTYSCVEEDVTESTDVIVVQNDGPALQYSLQDGNTTTQPENNEVYEGDRLTFNCTIRFGGSKLPVMELVFRNSTGDEQVLAPSSSSNVTFSSNHLASVTADYSVSQSDRRFSISCRLPSLNTSSMTRTSSFNTIYGPIFHDNRNQSVTLSGGSAVLNCSRDSYPTATIVWFRVQDGKATPMSESGDTAKVTATGDYRCTATNPRSKASATKVFNVTVETTSPPKDTKLSDESIGIIIGASVGGIVLIVIIAMVITYCVRRNKKKEGGKKPTDSELDSKDKSPYAASSRKDPIKPDSLHHLPSFRESRGNGRDPQLDYAELTIDKMPGSRKTVFIVSDPVEYAHVKPTQAPPY